MGPKILFAFDISYWSLQIHI